MNNVDKAMELAFDWTIEAAIGKFDFPQKDQLRTHLEAMEADRVRLRQTLQYLDDIGGLGKTLHEVIRDAIAQSEAIE